MPISAIRRRIAPLSLQFDICDESADEPNSPAPMDPADSAARILVEKALGSAGLTVAEAGRNGLVCIVELPSADFSRVVCYAWRVLARDDRHPQDGIGLPNEQSWMAWVPTEPPRAKYASESSELFAMAVSHGYHCFGAAADLAWLPADLVDGADISLSTGRLTSADMARLARELCGTEPSVSLSDQEAALLTVRHLRLVRRLEQPAAAS